eukprot:gene16321-biopygen11291
MGRLVGNRSLYNDASGIRVRNSCCDGCAAVELFRAMSDDLTNRNKVAFARYPKQFLAWGGASVARACPVPPGGTGHTRATPAPRPCHPKPKKMAYSPRHAHTSVLFPLACLRGEGGEVVRAARVERQQSGAAQPRLQPDVCTIGVDSALHREAQKHMFRHDTAELEAQKHI